MTIGSPSPLPVRIEAPALPSTSAPESGAADNPFGAMFRHAVAEVDKFQQQASQSAERFLNGESEEVHKVALDTQRAELSLDLFLQTRNRVVEAYQEIMRMQF